MKGTHLPVGSKILGPCIVEEQISTTLIPEGFAGTIDEYRNIIIESVSIQREMKRLCSQVAQKRSDTRRPKSEE